MTALACVALTASGASAAEQRVPTRLVWDGSACGSAADFSARVLRRSRTIRFVKNGEQVAVRLSIQPATAGLDARVRIEGKGRAPITRTIQSPDCEDALDALALVVAISVEAQRPSAERRPRAPAASTPPAAAATLTPPAETPPPATTPAGPPAAAATSPAEPPPVEAPPPPTSVPPAGADGGAPSSSTPDAASASPVVATLAGVDDMGVPPEPAPPAASGGLVLGAGLAAALSVGITPTPLLGGSFWLAVEWDRAGLWAPEVVLDALHQELHGHDEQRGQAEFALNALSLGLCPLRIGSPALELRPCASGAFGWLDAEGSQTYGRRGQTQPWSSVGAGLSLSAVLGIVELRASFGAALPTHRDSFRFDDDVFYHVAPVIWSGAVGAGLTPR